MCKEWNDDSTLKSLVQRTADIIENDNETILILLSCIESSPKRRKKQLVKNKQR